MHKNLQCLKCSNLSTSHNNLFQHINNNYLFDNSSQINKFICSLEMFTSTIHDHFWCYCQDIKYIFATYNPFCNVVYSIACLFFFFKTRNCTTCVSPSSTAIIINTAVHIKVGMMYLVCFPYQDQLESLLRVWWLTAACSAISCKWWRQVMENWCIAWRIWQKNVNHLLPVIKTDARAL